jgi:hypothetical protein
MCTAENLFALCFAAPQKWRAMLWRQSWGLMEMARPGRLSRWPKPRSWRIAPSAANASRLAPKILSLYFPMISAATALFIATQPAQSEILRCHGAWQNTNGVKVNQKIDIVLSDDLDAGAVVFIGPQGKGTELNPSTRYGKGILEWTSPGPLVDKFNLIHTVEHSRIGWFTGVAMRGGTQMLIIRVETSKQEKPFRMHSTLPVFSDVITGTCQ